MFFFKIFLFEIFFFFSIYPFYIFFHHFYWWKYHIHVVFHFSIIKYIFSVCYFNYPFPYFLSLKYYALYYFSSLYLKIQNPCILFCFHMYEIFFKLSFVIRSICPYKNTFSIIFSLFILSFEFSSIRLYVLLIFMLLSFFNYPINFYPVSWIYYLNPYAFWLTQFP